MTSALITNSLLRLDGVTGEPPSPFERPSDKMDFFVLALGLHDEVGSWCARTAEATLFVECAPSEPVFRLDTSFLSALTEAGISLE